MRLEAAAAAFLFPIFFCSSFSSNNERLDYINVPKVDDEQYDSEYDPPFVLRNTPISADVIVHSAYFDIEPNTTSYLFLMEVTRDIIALKKIVGCGVGNLKSKRSVDISVISPDTYKTEKATDQFEIILRCGDLPLLRGKSGFVLYKFLDDIVVAVETQKPVDFTQFTVAKDDDVSVLTCVNANDKDTPWLGEFLRYQKEIGVDHVHVSVFDEYIMSGRMFEVIDTLEDVKNLVLDGYVTLSMWNNWYEVNAVVPNQYSDLIRKLDCIFQYRHQYDYIFALDSDDFFNPVGSNKKLKSYLCKWCPLRDKKRSSCSFKSVQYYPGHCRLNPANGIISGNITSLLKSQVHNSLSESRAALCSDAVFNEVNINSSCTHSLVEGYGIVDVPESEAYIAKMDISAIPDGDLC